MKLRRADFTNMTLPRSASRSVHHESQEVRIVDLYVGWRRTSRLEHRAGKDMPRDLEVCCLEGNSPNLMNLQRVEIKP